MTPRWGTEREQSPGLLGGFAVAALPTPPGRPSHALPCLRVLGKTEGSLPVKLELSFGAPIPSTADSNGGERRRQREKREATVGINHGEAPTGKHPRLPQPRPRPLRSGMRPGAQRSAAAPPSGTGKHGVLCVWPPSHTSREVKTRRKPPGDCPFAF